MTALAGPCYVMGMAELAPDYYVNARYWDHLPDFETAEQFYAFAYYRDLGPTQRTYAQVARAFSLGYGTVVNWAKDKLWTDRVADYDRAQIAEREALVEAKAKTNNLAWAEQRAALLETAKTLTETSLEALLRKVHRGDRELRPNEIRLMLETLIKWQNLSHGDATEKVDVSHDMSKLSDEDIAILEKARSLMPSEQS